MELTFQKILIKKEQQDDFVCRLIAFAYLIFFQKILIKKEQQETIETLTIAESMNTVFQKILIKKRASFPNFPSTVKLVLN